ncbi:MAG: peptidoglycan glycosyltransferase [Acidimicrobiales bacterium]|nr:MAG: peptidoglycan glycosyltransferase [Acidimicrobiales bacterium]
MVVMGTAFVLVIGRLTWVQVFHNQAYAAVGRSELLHTVNLPAQRGPLLDRDGRVLAMSVPLQTVVADPHQIDDPLGEAKALAPVLKMSVATLQHDLSLGSGFVYLAHQVDDSTAAAVKALALTGISFVKEPKRELLAGDVAVPVLGQVGTEGHGQGGIEYQYDRQLAGHSGQMVVQRDPNGRDIPGGVVSDQAAQPGRGLVLTLDTPLQIEVRQALSNEVVTSKAQAGMAVVMDSRNGDILAMANLARSPNQPTGAPIPAPSNLALNEVFEPGSTAKVATIGGALQDHVVTPSQRLVVPDQLQVADATFHDAEAHPTTDLSVSDILARSSNVGTITIAKMLGKERINHFLQDFGFGRPTGLGFPGESAGFLDKPAHWSGTAIGAVPIGQDEAVTAVQMLDAYNVVANGGLMVPPRLVDATVDASGAEHPVPAQPNRRVISARTANQLKPMLEQVVQGADGTGKAAAIPGYAVAGKTGTAQKPYAGKPGYQPGAYMASFVGFIPAQRPALTAIVVLDQPTPIYGGSVGAPVFAEIGRYALSHFHVPPDLAPGSGPVTVPVVIPPPVTPGATTGSTTPTGSTTSSTGATTAKAASRTPASQVRTTASASRSVPGSTPSTGGSTTSTTLGRSPGIRSRP